MHRICVFEITTPDIRCRLFLTSMKIKAWFEKNMSLLISKIQQSIIYHFCLLIRTSFQASFNLPVLSNIGDYGRGVRTSWRRSPSMWSWIVIIQTGSQGRAGYMIAGGYSFHFTDPACCKRKQKNVKWKKKRIIIIDLTWQK